MRRLLVIITALTLFAAACGDDDVLSPDGTEAPGTTVTETTDSTDSGEMTTTTQAPSTTTDEGMDDGDMGDASDVEALLEAYQEVPLRITYRFDDGSGQEVLLTMSQDPTQDPPVSAVLMGQDGEEGRFISIGDQALICDPTSGGQCFEMPGGMDMSDMLLGPMMSGFLFAQGVTDAPGFSVEQSEIQVAGRSGLCFKYNPTQFDPEADVEEVRQCIDSEFGFILLVETIEPGQESRNLMELVEFGDPRPEDFEPTGPVTSMPGG